MAELRGTWVPETEEDAEFFMAVNQACVDAYEAGLRKQEIITGLSFVLSSVAEYDPEGDPHSVEEKVPDPPDRREDCPECGEPIEDVLSFIGTTCVVLPCNCETELEQVRGWVDHPEGDDE